MISRQITSYTMYAAMSKHYFEKRMVGVSVFAFLVAVVASLQMILLNIPVRPVSDCCIIELWIRICPGKQRELKWIWYLQQQPRDRNDRNEVLVYLKIVQMHGQWIFICAPQDPMFLHTVTKVWFDLIFKLFSFIIHLWCIYSIYLSILFHFIAVCFTYINTEIAGRYAKTVKHVIPHKFGWYISHAHHFMPIQ